MNTTTEQPFFQQQENVTSQIGGGDASGVANTTTTVAPDVPQAAALAAVPAAAAPGANNGNEHPNVIIDPNQPYQRIVRRGEDGEEIVEVIRVIQFRIDVKLMLKLILITAFACQDVEEENGHVHHRGGYRILVPNGRFFGLGRSVWRLFTSRRRTATRRS